MAVSGDDDVRGGVSVSVRPSLSSPFQAGSSFCLSVPVLSGVTRGSL